MQCLYAILSKLSFKLLINACLVVHNCVPQRKPRFYNVLSHYSIITNSYVPQLCTSKVFEKIPSSDLRVNDIRSLPCI